MGRFTPENCLGRTTKTFSEFIATCLFHSCGLLLGTAPLGILARNGGVDLYNPLNDPRPWSQRERTSRTRIHRCQVRMGQSRGKLWDLVYELLGEKSVNVTLLIYRSAQWESRVVEYVVVSPSAPPTTCGYCNREECSPVTVSPD